MEGKASRQTTIANNEPDMYINFTSYNCKNILNSSACLDELQKFSDVICIQEHWLFNFEQHLFKKFNSKLKFKSRSVDDNNPIPPTQKPRGYGGTAIAWLEKIDHLIDENIEDGNERIVCIKINVDPIPILAVSVYMPARGSKTSDEEFSECLDILFEITRKYHNDHRIILCGDWNCDLTGKKIPRQIKFQEFIDSCGYLYKPTSHTFVHPNGHESSTIDYILIHRQFESSMPEVKKLDLLPNNTSDHYPIITQLKGQLRTSIGNVEKPISKNINWAKIDVEEYQKVLQSKLESNIIMPGDEYIDAQKLIDIILEAQHEVDPRPLDNKIKHKSTKIWNDEIALALRENKQALHDWKEQGKPKSGQIVDRKKHTKTALRKARRQEIASQRNKEMDDIMKARFQDSKTFHKLVNSHKKFSKVSVDELIVGNNRYTTPQDILQGWKEHFEALATPTDATENSYTNREFDLDVIYEICKSDSELLIFTEEEVDEAIKSLNLNKAPDVFGLTAEHIKYGGERLTTAITNLINNICNSEDVPDLLKLGILTPVFKRKGLKFEAKNYRGITVLPIIGKCFEFLLRKRLRAIIDVLQNRLQRGFTQNVSPLYCALILYECILTALDSRIPIHIAFLDAKAAFDVVGHTSLYRKLFLAGIGGKLWLLIHQLSQAAQTTVKWNGMTTNPFNVNQGVRQGGVLSTDLYKLYINTVLDQIEDSGLGMHIGTISCAAPTCADDVALLASTEQDLQVLINTVENYSKHENYKLQPAKSVVMSTGHQKGPNFNFTLNEETMSQPETAVHLGITHNKNCRKTSQTQIQGNIEKARRTLYSLMGAGLYGRNGLNPTTNIHIFNVYVIPMLTYGLEILLPTSTELQKIEVFHRKTLKQILSIPTTTPDPAVYVLAGCIPIEAKIHKLALGMYANICRSDNSIEKEIAERQVGMKTLNDNSWFSKVRKILALYELPSGHDILDNPPKKAAWKNIVNKAVDNHWTSHFKQMATYYSTLSLNCDEYKNGKLHSLLASVQSSTRDVARLPTKLKLVTGTFHLQSNKAIFNQNRVDPTCLLCQKEPETQEHFILYCESLTAIRAPYLKELKDFTSSVIPCLKCNNKAIVQVNLSCILDPSFFLCNCACSVCNCTERLYQFEHITRRLCFALSVARYDILKTLPSTNRRGTRGQPPLT